MNADYKSLSSVMSTIPAQNVSNKYRFISTIQPIELLERKGFTVVDARETNAKVENMGYQKHVIRLRKSEDVGRVLKVDDLIPEIILTNAHNGTSAFNLTAGLYRCVCSNQMCVSDTTLETLRVLHKGYHDDKILDAAYRIVDETPKIMNEVDGFRNTKMSEDDQKIFALASLYSAYGEEKIESEYHVESTIERLIRPKRNMDSEHTLWNTLNVVQEKFTRGDRFLVSNEEMQRLQKYGLSTRYAKGKKTREIKSIDKDLKVNKNLWELAKMRLNLK